MQSLIFVSIAVIILIPIIHFSPLGLSLLGKNLIVLLSLLLSLFGLFANAILPLWQTLLVEVLLIGLVTYFMTKKLEVLLDSEEDIELETSITSETEYVLDHLSDKYKHIAISDKVLKLPKGEGIKAKQQLETEKADERIANWTVTVKHKDDENESFVASEGDDLAEFENRRLAVSIDKPEEGSANDTNELDERGYLAELEEYLMVDEDDAFEKELITESEDELEELDFESMKNKGNQSKPDRETDRNFDRSDLEDELAELFFEDEKSKEKASEKIY